LEKDRLELIENLKVDFNTSLQRLVESIEEGRNTNAELREFLDIATTDNSHLPFDRLRWLGGAAFRPYGFRPALNAYFSARDNGSLALIKNLALTEPLLDFEEYYGNFVVNRDLDRESTLTGVSYEVRKRLGTMAVLRADERFNTPDNFALSDEDYRRLIAQREIYAFFELKYKLRLNQMSNLENLKETTEQILAALEALE
jgi:hypothetical protein